MGNRPTTAKRTEDAENDDVIAGVADMQGWRDEMEDAHTLCPALPNKRGISLFAVFDGHGGEKVAQAASKRIVEQLTLHPKYAGADPNDPDQWGEILRDTFLALDEHLLHTVFRRPSSGRHTQRSYESASSGAAGSRHLQQLGVDTASTAGSGGAQSGRSESSDVWGDPARAFTPASSGRTPPHGSAGRPAGPPPDALELDIGVVDTTDGGSADAYFAHVGGTSDDEEPFERSGATAVAALILPSFIVTANAGDSRCVLLRGAPQVHLGQPDTATGASTSASALPLSEDHKPFLPEEEARIQAAGGAVMRGRVNGELAVSRALGDFSYKDRPDLPAEAQKVTALPDIRVFARTRCDGGGSDEARAPPNTPLAGQPGAGQVDMALVLACDGIWDVMDNSEVADYVALRLGRGRRNMPVLAGSIVDFCLHKDSRDNMTAMVVAFKDFLGALDEATQGLPKGPPGGHPPRPVKEGGGHNKADDSPAEVEEEVYDGDSYPPTPPLYDFGAESDTDDEFMLQSQMSGLDRSGSGGYPSDFPSLDLDHSGEGGDLDTLTPLDSTPCERDEEGGDPLAQTHRWKAGDGSLASMVRAAKSVLATGASSRSATHDGAFAVRKRGAGGLRPPRGGPTVKAPPGMGMSASWSLDDDIDAGTPRGDGTPLNGSVSDLGTSGTVGTRSRASSGSGVFATRSSEGGLSPIHDDEGGGHFQNTHFRPSSKRGRGNQALPTDGGHQRPSQIPRGGPTPGRDAAGEGFGFDSSSVRVGGTGSPEKPAKNWREASAHNAAGRGPSNALASAVGGLFGADAPSVDFGNDLSLSTAGHDLQPLVDDFVDTPVDRPLSSVSSDSDADLRPQGRPHKGSKGARNEKPGRGGRDIQDPSPMSRTQKVTMAHHRNKSPPLHNNRKSAALKQPVPAPAPATTARPAALSAPSPADSVSQPLGAASIASSATSAESTKHRVRRRGDSAGSTPPSGGGGVGEADKPPLQSKPHHVQRRPSSFSVSSEGGQDERKDHEDAQGGDSPNRGVREASRTAGSPPPNAPKPQLHIKVNPGNSTAESTSRRSSEPGSAPAVVVAADTPFLEFASPDKGGHHKRQPSDADIQDVLSRYGVTPKVEARRAAHSRRGSRNGTPLHSTMASNSRASGAGDTSFGGASGVHSGHASTLNTPQNKDSPNKTSSRTNSLGGRNLPSSDGGDLRRHFSFSGSLTPSLSAKRQAAATEFQNTKWALMQRQGAARRSSSAVAPEDKHPPKHRRGVSASGAASRRGSEDEGGEGGVNPPQSPLTTPAPSGSDLSPEADGRPRVAAAPSALGKSRGGSFMGGGANLRAFSMQPLRSQPDSRARLQGQLPAGSASLAPVRPVFGGGNTGAARPYEPLQRNRPNKGAQPGGQGASDSPPIFSGMGGHAYATRRATKFGSAKTLPPGEDALIFSPPSHQDAGGGAEAARRKLGPVRGVVGGGNSPPHLANDEVGGPPIRRSDSSNAEHNQARRTALGGREHSVPARSSFAGGEGGLRLGPSPVQRSVPAGFDAGRNANSMPSLPRSTVGGAGGVLQLPAAAWEKQSEPTGAARKPPARRPAMAPLRHKVQPAPAGAARATKLPPRSGKPPPMGAPSSARGVQGEAASLAPRPRLVPRAQAVKGGGTHVGGWRALAAEAASPAPPQRPRRPSSASVAEHDTALSAEEHSHGGLHFGVPRTRVLPAKR